MEGRAFILVEGGEDFVLDRCERVLRLDSGNTQVVLFGHTSTGTAAVLGGYACDQSPEALLRSSKRRRELSRHGDGAHRCYVDPPQPETTSTTVAATIASRRGEQVRRLPARRGSP